MTQGKAILFFELTCAGLPRAAGYKLLGYHVSYFRISDMLARNRLFNRWRRLGFHGMSYAEMPAAEVNAFFKRYVASFAEFFDNRVRLGKLETAIDRHFGLAGRASTFAWRGLRQRIQMRWFEVALVADHFGRRAQVVPTTLRLPPGGFGSELVGSLPDAPQTARPGLLELATLVAGLLGKGIARVLGSVLARRGPVGGSPAAGKATAKDPAQFEVLYFPHRGIAYGDLFVKDQYYAADPDSPFAAAKILHLAASRADEPSAASVRYYHDHGLAFDSLDRISPFGWRLEASTLIRFLRLAARAGALSLGEMWRWQGYRLAVHYFAFRMLTRFAAAVRALPAARVALVGYDMLFSPWLAAALSAAGVRTVASQERFILPFYGHLDVFVDRYLIWGERIREEMECHPTSFCRKELSVVGPPRAEHISELAAGLPQDDKYAQIRARSFLVLALDYHTSRTSDENRMARAATWELVRSFYEDMLSLACRYPTIHVVIKGKDLSNLANPYLAEVVGGIDRQPNIEIETALQRYSPAYMASVADLGVALHTSLGDEMLAAGKPCLFYDRHGFLDGLYDYEGFPVIVRSFDDLAERVGRMLESGSGAFMDEKDFKALRARLYALARESTRSRIQHELDSLLAMAPRQEARR